MPIHHHVLALTAALILAAPASANDPPDTWFAGPDPSVFGPGPNHWLDIADWSALPDLSGSLLSCDSLVVLPADRAPRRTFFEIYGNRLFVRSENDTVHMNSWIIVHGGGSDTDSPYAVRVDPADPALADTMACAAAGEFKVIHPAGPNSSPIGFRLVTGTLLDPAGPYSVPAQSFLFPNFDPASVFRAPTMAGYRAMTRSGKVYLVLRSQDGDGLSDSRIPTATAARDLADRVDAGNGTPQEIALRSKILTFYVNQAPYLRVEDPAFVPKPNQAFVNRTLTFNLLADDQDPYDQVAGVPLPGGPTTTRVLRWNVTLRGFDGAGQPVSHVIPGPRFAPQMFVTVPSAFVDPDVTVEVELCDCADCELLPGSGRCDTTSIPIQLDAPTATLAALVSSDAAADRVRLTWQIGIEALVRVERREPDSPWQELGEPIVARDRVTYEDRTVSPDRRYLYRLALWQGGRLVHAGEAAIETPRQLEFALEGIRPNPSRDGERRAHFSLPTMAPARLETFDMSGRKLATQALGTLGAGPHVVALDRGLRLPAGMYWVRLTQGVRSAAVRIVVLD